MKRSQRAGADRGAPYNRPWTESHIPYLERPGSRAHRGRCSRSHAARAGSIAIDLKGVQRLVTEVGPRFERAIVSFLTERFPDHSVYRRGVPPSSSAAGASLVHRPARRNTNYIHGVPSMRCRWLLAVDGQVAAGGLARRTRRCSTPSRTAVPSSTGNGIHNHGRDTLQGACSPPGPVPAQSRLSRVPALARDLHPRDCGDTRSGRAVRASPRTLWLQRPAAGFDPGSEIVRLPPRGTSHTPGALGICARGRPASTDTISWDGTLPEDGKRRRGEPAHPRRDARHHPPTMV